MECDTCAYYAYDEEWEEWVCTVNMDEDDWARMLGSPRVRCPYYRDGDEYKIAGKQ